MMMPVMEYYQQVSLCIKKRTPTHKLEISISPYAEKHYRMLIKTIITDKRENSNYVFSFTSSLCDIQSFCVCTLSDLSQMFSLSTNACLMGLNSCFQAMTHHYSRGEKEQTLLIWCRCTYISVNRSVRHSLLVLST